ncbi:hypothetical protein [Mycoplasmopsis columboralis]|uniref:Uncharacterized protein n=1 Tax=Mycoplasmopsis columboralis TaxID=171282 RepID=A0A449B5Z9_9BACT|nr:hypothetical protein [Mycoplasmopsis columboralis]VEU75948.1 Uncharacterised protein [Mycoplasmopsis columboralis]
MEQIFLTWFDKKIIISEFVGSFFITFGACLCMFVALKSSKKYLKYHFTYPWATALTPIVIFITGLLVSLNVSDTVVIGNPINLFIIFCKLIITNHNGAYFKGFCSIIIMQLLGIILAVILYRALFKRIAPQNYLKQINSDPDFTMHTFKEFGTLFALCGSVALFGQLLFANNFTLFFVNAFLNGFITGVLLFVTRNHGYFTSSLNVLLGVNFIYLINKQKTWKSALALLISTVSTIVFSIFWALILVWIG